MVGATAPASMIYGMPLRSTLLPVLQTYLGHSSIADTAYYLRLTAESYPHISAQVQRVIGDVVPPITAGPRHGH